MRQSVCYHRTRLLKLLRDKNVSHAATNILMTSFQDIQPDKKESVAQQMYSLIENCESDNDVMRIAYSVITKLDVCDRVGKISCEQRHKLVKVMEKKAFSAVARQRIMRQLMESPCETPREVEQLASQCIPLVQKCRTESEAIDAVNQFIAQKFGDIFGF